MKCYKFWLSLGILCICFTRYTQECSPPLGWHPMEPSERAKKAQIVLYGTVVASPRVRNRPEIQIEGRYNAEFRLHCIIKGPKLKALVNITGFGDFPGGFCVHSTAMLNKSYVVFVEHALDTGELRLQEINVQKGSVHVGQVHKVDNLAILREVMIAAGQNASLPLNASALAKPGCPNFSASFPSKSRDPERKTPKHAKSCRCRRKKHKRRKRKRLSKVRTLPSTGQWQEKPTLPRTRRYNVLTGEEGDVEGLLHDLEIYPVRACASRPHRGSWWQIVLTFHGLVLTLIMWQNT